jgi:hypothetical protein
MFRLGICIPIRDIDLYSELQLLVVCDTRVVHGCCQKPGVLLAIFMGSTMGAVRVLLA